MAITYPLSHPTVPDFSRFDMKGESVVALSESPFTWEQQVIKHQGQRFVAGVTLPPMERADAETWIAFGLSLDGRLGTFLLGDPLGGTARGVATGTPLVDGAGQTGQVLNTKGWTTGQTGILLAGDYISLGTGLTTRLYKVLQDANSDGGGLAVLDMWPRLRETPADNAVIAVSNCKGLFRLANNNTEWNADTAQFYGFGFSAMEAI